MSMQKYLPSQRTMRKFIRDFAAAFVVFAGAYVAEHYRDLELSSETVAILTPLALLA